MNVFLDFSTGSFALAYFLMISAATKQHFVSDRYPVGMYLISTLSLVGIFTFLWQAFLGNLVSYIGPLVLMAAAFALFLWAARHSARIRLPLAFDDTPRIDGIITTGPWRFVRHPFYVSYILFWAGCAWGTRHMSSLVVLGTLAFIYGYSAIREERALRKSRLGDEYLAYSQSAGFFLPKLMSRN